MQDFANHSGAGLVEIVPVIGPLTATPFTKRRVPLPPADPVYGPVGPRFDHWK